MHLHTDILITQPPGQQTQEFTLNGDYDKLNFVGGLFYFNEFFHNDRLSQSAGSPFDNIGVISHANSYLKTQSYAAFANADYKFTEAFSTAAKTPRIAPPSPSTVFSR